MAACEPPMVPCRLNQDDTTDASDCLVLHPTTEEFSLGMRAYYSAHVETNHRFRREGVVKIVAPRDSHTESHQLKNRLLEGLSVKPTEQVPLGRSGVVSLALRDASGTSSRLPLPEFLDWGLKQEAGFSPSVPWQKIERRYWWALTSQSCPPRYASDQTGSLFGGRAAHGWNLDRLDTEIQLLGQDIPGINRSMLYVGTWRSTFAWHKEDVDLPSINYLHQGAPKFWYVLRPDDADRFEQLAQGLLAQTRMDTGCKHFLRHKTSVIAPSKLRSSGVSFRRVMQYPGEYVITHPAAFHSGFNTGVNVAEAVNFATWSWLPWGKAALRTACNCSPDNVRIDVRALERAMQVFERRRRLRLLGANVGASGVSGGAGGAGDADTGDGVAAARGCSDGNEKAAEDSGGAKVQAAKQGSGTASAGTEVGGGSGAKGLSLTVPSQQQASETDRALSWPAALRRGRVSDERGAAVQQLLAQQIWGASASTQPFSSPVRSPWAVAEVGGAIAGQKRKREDGTGPTGAAHPEGVASVRGPPMDAVLRGTAEPELDAWTVGTASAQRSTGRVDDDEDEENEEEEEEDNGMAVLGGVPSQTPPRSGLVEGGSTGEIAATRPAKRPRSDTEQPSVPAVDPPLALSPEEATGSPSLVPAGLTGASSHQASGTAPDSPHIVSLAALLASQPPVELPPPVPGHSEYALEGYLEEKSKYMQRRGLSVGQLRFSTEGLIVPCLVGAGAVGGAGGLQRVAAAALSGEAAGGGGVSSSSSSSSSGCGSCAAGIVGAAGSATGAKGQVHSGGSGALQHDAIVGGILGPEARKRLRRGDRLGLLSDGQVYVVAVTDTETRPGVVRLHYPGWPKSDDEWESI